MGISGLLPLLKDIQVPCNISDYKGKKLAVDGYVWLHKGAFGCAEDLVKGRKTTRFVDYAMHRVRMLRHYGVTPLIVFDGGPLPAKKGTESSRAKSRAESLARAQSLEAQGRLKDARDCYTKCLDVTPEHAYQLIKSLRAENVDYVVAPYEADAQLCYLEREGYVDGIITEDSDLLVFGCKHVVFKLEKDGSCVSIDRSRLATIRDFPMHGWTDTQFRRMAMLSGCDYLPSIPGIGLKKAHKMLRRYKTVEKMLQAIRLEGSHNIPSTYLADFAQAELAFIHQRVFEPTEQRLIPLNPFPEAGLGDADERWIGLDVPVETARGMARGDIHPETRVPIEDMFPDFKPGALGNATRTTAVLKESVKLNTTSAGGPLDAFFTRVKRTKSAPVSLPTPVGAMGSGIKRLSDLGAQARRASDPAMNEATHGAGPSGKASKFFSTNPATKETSKVKISIVEEESFDIVWEDDKANDSRFVPTQDLNESLGEDVHVAVKVDTDDAEMDIESQPKLFNQTRSPSPEHLRSPTPVQFRSPSPVVSPPHLSSPVASPASIPFTTPPKSSPHRRFDIDCADPVEDEETQQQFVPSSPSLVRASRHMGSGVLVAASSQFVQTITTLPTQSSQPAPNTGRNNSILVPPSSPGPARHPPSPAAEGGMDLRETLRIGSKKRTAISSDSIDDEVIVTPSIGAAGVKRSRQRRSSGSVGSGGGGVGGSGVVQADEEVVAAEAEEEARREQRAKVVAEGWRMKYALNTTPSANKAGKGTPSSRKGLRPTVDRTVSTPTPKMQQHQQVAEDLDRSTKSVVKRTSLPVSAMANAMAVQSPRVVLAPKATNQVEKVGRSGAREEKVTPRRQREGKEDWKGEAKEARVGGEEIKGEGKGEVKPQPLGLTWSALEKFRFNRFA